MFCGTDVVISRLNKEKLDTVMDCLTKEQIDFIENLMNLAQTAFDRFFATKATYEDKCESQRDIENVKCTLYGYIEGLYNAKAITGIERNKLMHTCILGNASFSNEYLNNFKFLRLFP